MDKFLEMPLYAKSTFILVGLFALFSILYITSPIVVPLVFAILIAIVLSPVIDFLTRHKINRILSIVVVLVVSSLFLAGLLLLILAQFNQFTESWPIVVQKFTLLLNQTIGSTAEYLKINPVKIHTWIDQSMGELVNFDSTNLGQTIVSVGSGLAVLLLMPVYVFLILYYQPLLLEFIRRVFGPNNESGIGNIVTQTKVVVQNYLIGLFFEAILVAILNISILLILGIDYAILLGILGALLNLIPYIGGIVAVALPMAIALVTKSTAWYSIYVLISYGIIQFIDNNFIVPKIVASKVKINALFSIIVVLIGNALWGISGMFLSIPILAIVKLIFDNIDSLKPWGFLLGDTIPRIKRQKKHVKLTDV